MIHYHSTCRANWDQWKLSYEEHCRAIQQTNRDLLCATLDFDHAHEDALCESYLMSVKLWQAIHRKLDWLLESNSGNILMNGFCVSVLSEDELSKVIVVDRAFYGGVISTALCNVDALLRELHHVVLFQVDRLQEDARKRFTFAPFDSVNPGAGLSIVAIGARSVKVVGKGYAFMRPTKCVPIK